MTASFIEFRDQRQNMRGFSDEERDRIREELVETGRELLVIYGPEKTNVADITEPVGIAKSTFYRFFDSKNDLYLEILQRETEEYQDTVREQLEGIDDPREGLERFFRSYAAFAEDNPLVQQMLLSSSYREMLNDVPQERYEEIQREGIGEFQPFVESFQEESDGPIADLDLATVFGVMSTIGIMVLHEEEFERYGEGYYEQVQDALITSLARGLTAEK